MMAYVHRHLTHQTVVMSPVLINIIKTMKWLVTWRGYDLEYDRRWAAAHIMHHRFTDTEKDPYLPFIENPLERNVHYWQNDEFVGEKLNEKLKHHRNTEPTAIDYFFNKYPYGILLLTAACLSIWGVVGIFLVAALMFIPTVDRFFNFFSHRFPGYANTPKDTVDESRNVYYLSFLYLGEDLHANHHHWPRLANHGVRWWEIDITYWVLKFLSLFGLVKFPNYTPDILDLTWTPVNSGKINR